MNNMQRAKRNTGEAYKIYERLKKRGFDDMDINNVAVNLRIIANGEDFKLRYAER